LKLFAQGFGIWMNDSDLYQIEDPSSNRSHVFELPGNDIVE